MQAPLAKKGLVPCAKSAVKKPVKVFDVAVVGLAANFVLNEHEVNPWRFGVHAADPQSDNPFLPPKDVDGEVILPLNFGNLIQGFWERNALKSRPSSVGYLLGLFECFASFVGNKAARKAQRKHSSSLFLIFI